MLEHKITPLSPHITQITDPTGVYMFLVRGDREAVLIDTGVGFRGLRETAEAAAGGPVSVILTHMHPDHAGGVGAFERVWLHPADRDNTSVMAIGERMGYAGACMPGAALTAEDFIPAPPADREYLPLEDGQVFDLGGLTLEIVHVPGHTPGSCCVLFREERAILFGDACNANTLLLWGTPVSRYRESLLRLQTFEDRFDTVYYSHGPQAQGPGRALEDNIELCGRILAGTDDAVPTEFMGMTAYRAAAMAPNFARLDGKYGNIVYTQETRR